MARKIDFENLTDEDLRYVSDRGWLVAEGDYLGHDVSGQVAAWRAGEVTDEELEEEDDEQDVIEYKDATVDQLKAELTARGLDTDGKKADLIARLEANDLEEDDEEEA